MDPDDVSGDLYIVETRYDDQFMLYGFFSSLSLSSSVFLQNDITSKFRFLMG